MSSTKKRSRSSQGGGRKRSVQKADDLDIVLAKCRELKANLRKDTSKVEDKPDGIPSDIVEVAELSASEVLGGIEGIALNIAHQVLAKKGFSMDIPSRAASNQVYVKEWDRIVLGGKRSARNFMNVKVRVIGLRRAQ